MPGRSILSIVAAVLILAGCVSVVQEPMEVCPGKESVGQALAALQSHSRNMVSLRAKGQCRLQYSVDRKKHNENLTATILLQPPFDIYLQGDAALVPKAVILGSNEQEFWLSLSPKEISTYWWGKWSEQDSSEGLVINPRTLLEALGIAEVDVQEDWSLSNEGPFDILTKRELGVVTKKIYVYSCDYRVRKIEYFDGNGQAVACTELTGYREVSELFSVPALIKITTYAKDNTEDSLSITLDLKSVRPMEITEKVQNRYFNRPQPRGIKHERRIIGGKWIEIP